MIDPKLFEAMKPEQAARAAVALVIYHALAQRPDMGPHYGALEAAFQQADLFLERALKP